MSINQSGTFIYAPDIKCGIKTQSGEMLDVSDDIVNFQISRQISAVSQLSMTLTNVGFKYNGVINTMDPITVFLKRTDWVQVFTGYITFAPILTIVPTPINIAADCTLRILQNTYWDDTLISFQQLLLNFSDGVAMSSNRTLNDGGVAQAIINVLVDVCKWNPDAIHIGNISQDFVNLAVQIYNSTVANGNSNLPQNVVQEVLNALGAKHYVSPDQTFTPSGPGANPLSVTIRSNGAPAGTSVTVHSVVAYVTQPNPHSSTAFSQTGSNNFMDPRYLPGSSKNDAVNTPIPQDPFWCAAPFAYINDKPNSKDFKDSVQWLATHASTKQHAGKVITVINNDNGAVVNLRAVYATRIPNQYHKNGEAVTISNTDGHDYLQISPAVMQYLLDPTTVVTTWDSSTTPVSTKALTNVTVGWAKTDQRPGPAQSIDNSNVTQNDSMLVLQTINTVVSKAEAQVGVPYLSGGGWFGRPSGPRTAATPGFDCIGLCNWAYHQAGINVPNATTETAIHDNRWGAFIDKNTPPRKGDVMFWSDGKDPSCHATLLVQDFDINGAGMIVQAEHPEWQTINGVRTHTPGGQVQYTPINWHDIQGGKPWRGWGMSYAGARRPVTTMPQYAKYSASTPDPASATSSGNNWNSIWNQPQYDVRAAAIVGSDRAFLLDNNVMGDIQQIVGAGLRDFMSAPNGDFIAWFPDYWGIYGTDPAIEISPIEIMDFQIYHDDNQLVTHYGVIGDTVGVGQQVSPEDYMTTNGIVSISDQATMKMLFGSINPSRQTIQANKFLQKYGMRPMKVEQNMIHSHALEYFFGLKGFMEQWGKQFASTVMLTFMPELYPGMRIIINLDESTSYQFYCTAVVHQGSRTGGFTTQATLTAPKQGKYMLSYGIEFS